MIDPALPDDRGNFAFLADFDPLVSRLARQAEQYVHTDPEACLFKLRLMVETMTRRLIEMQRPDLVSRDLSTMLRALQQDRLLSRARADSMHLIRRDGNAAVHGTRMTPPTAMRRLRDAHRLAAWFARVMQRGATVAAESFRPPAGPEQAGARQREALERAERLETEIEAARHRTREALMLFGSDFDADRDAARMLGELEALDRVAVAAGEPTVDADSVGLIMAMELEALLLHPRLGMTTREARDTADRQLAAVKADLDGRERAYELERDAVAGEVQGDDLPAGD